MLKLNHLTGFGSGAAAAAGTPTSYVFDGTGDYLSIPDHASWDFGTGDWTFELWFKSTDSTGGALLCRWDSATPKKSIELHNISGVAEGLMSTDGSTTADVTGTTNIDDNAWHHIAYVRNGNTQTLYIDGVSEGTPTSESGVTFASDVPVLIGAQNPDSPNWFCTGYIDEVRISDIARYTTGFTPTTTQFVSDANTLLLIHGGEAYTAPLTGETTQSCINFDGTGDYLTIPDHADWDFAASDFTIEFFVKSGTAGRMVASRGVLNGGSLAWFIHDDTTNIRFRYSTNGSDETNVDAAINLNDDVFTHIAIVRESTSLKIYENGTEKVDHNISTNSIHDPSAPLLLGCRNENAAGISSFMDGGFAEIRISNTARWSTGFTPSTTRYTSDANTKLLIHGDENGGGTAAFTDSGNTGHTVTPTGNAFLGNGGTFTDSGNTGHTVSENGQAQKETEQEFKFTDDGVGYFLDGTGDYLSVPDHADWQLGGGGGSWTIDFWIRFTDCSGIHTLLTQSATDQNDGWALQWNFSSNNVQFSNCIAGAETPNVNGSAVAKANTWHHVAVVRNVNAYSIYLDGVSVASGSDATGYVDIGQPLEIGRRSDGIRYFTGYMDEIRISDTARWTTGFTPSSTQYSSDANTLLLIHGGETKSGTTGSGATFTDSGNTGHTVTENGNAIESTGNFYKF